MPLPIPQLAAASRRATSSAVFVLFFNFAFLSLDAFGFDTKSNYIYNYIYCIYMISIFLHMNLSKNKPFHITITFSSANHPSDGGGCAQATHWLPSLRLTSAREFGPYPRHGKGGKGRFGHPTTGEKAVDIWMSWI